MTSTDPAPVEQEPAAQRIEGASFSATMKLLSTMLLIGIAYAAWQTLQQGAWQEWSPGVRWSMGLLIAAIVFGYWGILSSRTSVDGHFIRQSGPWPKQVELAQITRLKLIHVPGLDWLVAPRLVVRCGSFGLTTFHVADPKVLAAVKLLAYG
jgi:hypothetical protein